MSFIYDDKNLINDLIKSALEFDARFIKKSQNKPSLLSDFTGKTLAPEKVLKLLDNLETSITNTAHPELGEITSATGDSDLTSANLENLGALINFLIKNQIMINYQRIAYDSSDVPQSSSYKLVTTETNPYFSASNIKGFYVDPNLLHKYLISLQATNAQKNIKGMDIQLKALISDASREFGLKINPYKEPSAEEEIPGSAYYMKSKPKSDQKDPRTAPQTKTQTTITDADIQELMDSLPLAVSDINFRRIENFFELYSKIIGTDPKFAGSALSNIQEARNNIANVQNYTNTNIFPLADINVNTAMAYINKQNKQTAFVPFLEALKQVVINTANVVADMQYSLKPWLTKHQDWIAKITWQLGPGQIKYSNISKLQRLIDTPLETIGPRR